MGVRVADILRAGPCTAFQRGIPPVVHRAYQAIIGCHTARMGGHAVVCPKGHVEFVAYNACRNRNCPHCAGYRIRRWLESKAQTLLGCPHHHIIFTIPHELNGLWLLNYKPLAELLFRSARAALFELALDVRYLGAQPGAFMALHTWGQQLALHPHVHCLVTAGGADSQRRWLPARRKSLLPAQPLKKLFQKKFLYGLRGLAMEATLRLPDGWTSRQLLELCHQLQNKRWNVRVCERYENPKAVLSYLGRYLNGGPMAERRLLDFDGQRVTFRYKDYRDIGPEGPREKVMQLERDKFVRRYLQHVPPNRFHMVRGYGLYRHGGNSGQIRHLLRQIMPLHPELQQLLEPEPEPLLRDKPPEDDSDGMQCCSVCGSPLDAIWLSPRAGPLRMAA